MAYNKKNEFSSDQVLISEFAKALSHPARIAILAHLAEKRTCICGEIVDVLPLAQSTVSQHLKELKKAGLITGDIDGPKSCYCINNKMLDTLSDRFAALIKSLKSDCCKIKKG